METKMYRKNEVVALGVSAASLKDVVPAEFVKTGKRGRPAGLYSQEQVDAMLAGKPGNNPVAENTGTPGDEQPETDAQPSTADAAEAMDAGPEALSEQDFAEAAAA